MLDDTRIIRSQDLIVRSIHPFYHVVGYLVEVGGKHFGRYLEMKGELTEEAKNEIALLFGHYPPLEVNSKNFLKIFEN